MLLQVDRNFFQVIEGDVDVVHALLDRIARDPRHGSIVRIVDEPLHQRHFDGWSMGFASTSASQLNAVIGFNDFFSGASCLTTLTEGRAKKLLTVFARGRWQRSALARAS